ncbi:MAG: sigma-54 dependent transcriptional regulator [Myxococcota bacterium]|nr:sigma-54 dependent transcriptional regulator [Myxococcota bacterium]
MKRAPTVLLIEDEEPNLKALTRLISRQGYQVFGAMTGQGGLDLASERGPDLAIVDLQLPDLYGEEVIRRMQSASPGTQCIVLTATGSAAKAFECLQAGATDYFEKPIVDFARFFQVLRKAVEIRDLKEENRRLRRGNRDGVESLIGNSRAMQELKQMLTEVGPFPFPVLITGESGTGKEVVARAVHASSNRREGPFLAVNCAAIPEQLLESTLFGAEKGAFTGADKMRVGLFEEAQDGTLLLDEIGDMPLNMQVKLLRVLEMKEITRLGANKPIKVNARVLTATHRNLQAWVSEGKFREDLYHRIKVIEVKIPPLRERLDDVPLLAYYFLKELNAEYNREVRIDSSAMNTLAAYPWSRNNVRELRGQLTRAFVLCKDDNIMATDLDLSAEPRGLASRPPADAAGGESDATFGLMSELVELNYRDAKEEVLKEFSRQYLQTLLQETGGNITRAADRAGMERPNFRRLLKRYGVTRPTGSQTVEG